MSINQLLNSLAKRQRNAAKELDSGCTIRARRLLSRRRDKLMVMFKRSGIWKKKQPCGMLDCATCAIFWRKLASGHNLLQAEGHDVSVQNG
jgi:hypothetical protein